MQEQVQQNSQEIAVIKALNDNMSKKIDDIALGMKELNGKIDVFTQEIRSRINELDDEHSRKYASKQDISGIDTRVEKVENNITWIVRVVVGAVVMAILGIILVS